MDQTVSPSSTEIASKLLQIKAIKLSPQNPFTWASGIKSPIYCDNRIVLSYPNIRRSVIQALRETAQGMGSFNMIAGVATAGIAHGALLAHAMDLPFVYVRSKAKGHGRQNRVEGELRGNERILVIEDLISTGGSCLEAVKVLRDRGCHVEGVLAIFSYGFARAQDAFAAADCPFQTLTNYQILVEEAVKSGYISAADQSSLQAWRKAPEKWGLSGQSNEYTIGN
ncbi:MAG: orotate phosphoribosyltransferase [Bacteroidota bacterium]